MADSDKLEPMTLECPGCGAPLAHSRASDFDEAGARRHEFRCPNGHHIVVERHQTYEEQEHDSAVPRPI
jgi:hypothetical protein